MRDRPSKLERAAVGAPQTKKVDPGRLELAATGARVREPFVIPRLGLPAVITLLAHDRISLIEAEVAEFERALNLTPGFAADVTIETERAARYCAEAVIDPDTINADGSGDWKPIGPLEVWRTKIDPDVVGDVYRFYADVRAKFDPVGVGCTQEDLDAIAEIVKKVEAPSDLRLQLLRHYGVRRLSSWLVTMGSQLFSSTTPELFDGASFAASSTPTSPPTTMLPGPGET
jgi:hypothetical protein